MTFKCSGDKVFCFLFFITFFTKKDKGLRIIINDCTDNEQVILLSFYKNRRTKKKERGVNFIYSVFIGLKRKQMKKEMKSDSYEDILKV